MIQGTLTGTHHGSTPRSQIWIGTNEIMRLLIQDEYYKESLNDPNPPRISEADAEEAHPEEEKVYEDEEMWTKGW